MDGLLVLLGLAALAAVILGPIGFFAAMGHGGRLRVVERALDDLRQRLVEAERQLAAGAGATAAQAERVAEFDAPASEAAPLPEDLAAAPPPVAPDGRRLAPANSRCAAADADRGGRTSAPARACGRRRSRHGTAGEPASSSRFA